MSEELTRVIRLESEINELQAKIRELEATLTLERKVAFRIATHAERIHLQLEAIKEAALGGICSITPDGPENLKGLEELE